jgi:FtsP/CotA-like multicopper oxidase with cupredoxin domain
MRETRLARRRFLKTASLAAGATWVAGRGALGRALAADLQAQGGTASEAGTADYTLRIQTTPVEIAHKRFISLTTYNGQFPGPLLRLKEGKPVSVEIHNDTDIPEQLHWHGQMVGVDVDGAAEEGTPYVLPHGKRRIVLTPQPAGVRFYHTHVRAGADLSLGQYGGQVGTVFIEPAHDPGSHDREVFLMLKEFEPSFSQGGDMPQDFLSPAAKVKELEQQGESAMKASISKGTPHGFEVGYRSFTINGRMLGHGEPVRVKQGETVLFHVVNGSATELRSLALPGHSFHVVALDGNPVPNPAPVRVLWLGPGERVSATVDMRHSGVWIMGDVDDDDRKHGMGIVVEYAGATGKAQWVAPPKAGWSYARFAKPDATPREADETIDMLFAKDNAAFAGFNRWTINGVAYPSGEMAPAAYHLKPGKRYRLRMRNASDDIHPIHLHRHSFELTRWGGKGTAGVMKDVLMLGGYQEAEVDFVANNPGLTLFHCHQQLHMDYGFMTLFDYP